MNELNKLAEIMPLLSTIQGLSKPIDIKLWINEKERPMSLKNRISGYIIDNVTNISNSKKESKFQSWLQDWIIKSKKDDITFEELAKFIDKQKQPGLYSGKDVLEYAVLKDKWIDKHNVIEESRINIEIFKLIINDLKDGDDVAFTTKEIELLHSDWNSEFWKDQDVQMIRESVQFFRTKNKLGVAGFF